MSSGSVGADMILANARSVGFDNICYKNVTPSDGNCWYHAVLDQIRRPDISHLFPANLLNLDHRQLRNSVLLFVLQNQNFNAQILHFKTSMFQNNEQGWNLYLQGQGRNGSYASDIFCQSTAIFLNVRIETTSNISNALHPSYFLNDIETTRATLLIGNMHNRHFQSLIPSNVFGMYVTEEEHNIHFEVNQNVSSPPALKKRKIIENKKSYNNNKDKIKSYKKKYYSENKLKVKGTLNAKKLSVSSINSAQRNKPLPKLHDLVTFDNFCEHCNAFKFENELHFKCCHSGKVSLQPLKNFPDGLTELFTGNFAEAKHLRKNIRQYNNCFSFTSMGANIRPPPNNGPPCFRICGQIHHRHGSLYPDSNNNPLFSQLYIIEAAAALNLRMSNPANENLHINTVKLIQNILNDVSPYAASYKWMAQVENEEQLNAIEEKRSVSSVTMIMRAGVDRRRCNAPLHEEVAAIFTGEDGAPPAARDIVIYPRDKPLQKISCTSPHIDPMAYPLIFPKGDFGWDTNLSHNGEYASEVRNRVTQSQFYNYRIAIRSEFSALHLSSRLFQQFLVDAYVKVEGQRLDFIKRNQAQLRADSYRGLHDFLEIEAERQGLRAGRVTVLPSTFPGSPRNMHQKYLDAMAFVAKKGKPDLFITFTCNPKWCEITKNLLHGQTANDRPDLVARVFMLKLKALKLDLKNKFCLGVVCGHVDVVEFQKRGLPHCHMLLHFQDEFKLRNADDIDALISAQIPDEEKEPDLYDIIKSSMIHGPCGHLNKSSPCMVDGSCSKDYTKAFNESTVLNQNGYPLYHRPDNGRTVKVRNTELDNRWVVPYNPFLSKKYNAHINVEACVSIKSVKYIYKYIYKGHDVAHIQINERIDHNEIITFVDGRYVSAPEAMWRLSEFPLCTQSHTVIRLAVHLPNEQQIYFCEGQEQTALDKADAGNTMLTAWFHLNQHCEDARNFFYTDMPYHYVFDSKNKQWNPRKRGAEKIISRMFNASIREGERYFLLNVPGATSFNYLKTYNNTVFPSFREACLARFITG